MRFRNARPRTRVCETWERVGFRRVGLTTPAKSPYRLEAVRLEAVRLEAVRLEAVRLEAVRLEAVRLAGVVRRANRRVTGRGVHDSRADPSR